MPADGRSRQRLALAGLTVDLWTDNSKKQLAFMTDKQRKENDILDMDSDRHCDRSVPSGSEQGAVLRQARE